MIRFLREREIVHFQRFGECLRLCKEKMNSKNVYLTNPAFDKQMTPQPPECLSVPESAIKSAKKPAV